MKRNSLNRPILSYAWCATILAASTSACLADPIAPAAWNTPPTSQSRSDLDRPCVLLRNDNVVFGTAQQQGDQVVIRRGDGSQIRVARKQVLCWADRLTDLYQYRTDHRVGDSLDVHVTEARWCLRYGMLDQARIEIDRARRIDPVNRQAELLYRQLEGAIASAADKAEPASQPSNPRTVAAAADTATARNTGDSSNVFRSSVTIDDTPVVQVDHQVAVDTNMLHTFVSHVQPILINRCGNCHSHSARSRSPEMQWTLLKPQRGVRTSARMARENYLATIDLVDFSQPGESALLKYAATAHGGGDVPLGLRNAMASETLKQWASLVADHHAVDSDSQMQVPAPTEPQRETSTTSQAAAEDTNVAGGVVPQVADASPKVEMQRLPRVTNPFDPDLFNRKFHPEQRR
tara:strand:+ start:187199 stop:188413 length:1215 start_codon:yes stop_codon:yes gene_type:complete